MHAVFCILLQKASGSTADIAVGTQNLWTKSPTPEAQGYISHTYRVVELVQVGERVQLGLPPLHPGQDGAQVLLEEEESRPRERLRRLLHHLQSKPLLVLSEQHADISTHWTVETRCLHTWIWEQVYAVHSRVDKSIQNLENQHGQHKSTWIYIYIYSRMLQMHSKTYII